MAKDTQALMQWLRVARGEAPADLCLKNVRVVNVFTGTVEAADVAIHQGLFVGPGSYEAKEVRDLRGAFMAPGFIDAHLHLESTLLSPEAFCRAVLPHGTTCVVVDPHEIANVLGTTGIRALIQRTENLPVDFFFMLPSCVPASPLETSGAVLSAADLHVLRSHPRVLGLAEMMNFPGLVHGDPQVVQKMVLFQDGPIDGHCPRLSGRDLNAYVGAGVGTDHETTTLEEALEKLSKGMVLLIREGSQSKDLLALLPAITDATWPWCVFVTDDRHPTDLLEDGHMDVVVNKAVSAGLDPTRAVAMATVNPARHFRLGRRGAVAPGYLADFSISPSLHPWKPVSVYKNGREVVREGSLVEVPAAGGSEPFPESPMFLPPLHVNDLRIPAEKSKVRVIVVREGTLLTDEIHHRLPERDGCLVSDPHHDVLKVAVYNRYGEDRLTKPSVGFVRGFGLRTGALASTVAHDSHNLIVVGASDEAMIRTARAVADAGGGLAAGDEDGVRALVPLPIAGLMSDKPLEEVCSALDELNRAAGDLGSSLKHPLMALSFLALPVIPKLKITDRGLVDVERFDFVSLFVTD